MAALFELGKGSDGQFRFTLKASNGETILTSEGYGSKASAQRGIAAVRANCGEETRYEKKESKNGKFYFTLKAANGQVIGQSQMYSGEKARDAGIESVQQNAPGAPTSDLTAAG